MKLKVIQSITLLFLLSAIQGCVTPKNTKQEIKVETLSKTTKSWNGNTLAPYPKGQPEITILKITIPPHTKFPPHMHPFINGGIVLDGEITVTQGEKKHHLKSGDTIVEVVDTWHYGANESDKPTTLLAFYAGIEGKPLTIKK
jgi:quercetin dioxygenase-like cupin family protein